MDIDKDNNAVDFEKIANYLVGEVTDEEKESLEAWLESSPSNEILFNKIKRVWEASEVSEEAFNPDVALAWEKVQKVNNAKVLPYLNNANTNASKPWYLYIAASLVLLASVAIGWFALKEDHFIQKLTLQTEKVKAHKKGEVTLADGSKVWLNSHTQLYYPETFDQDRIVYLEGEAFFEVVRDEAKPFFIYTGKGVTKVLGTSFNINTENKTIVVTVANGQVALYPDGSPEKQVVLEKGERGVFKKKDKAISKIKNTDINYLSWRTGILTFEDASLSTVAEALSKHYHVAIDLKEGNSNHCRLTSTFKNQTLEEVLELLQLTLDVEIKKEKDQILLLGKGC